MITAIAILYALIAAFTAGWIFSGAYHNHTKLSAMETLGGIGLCIAWPYTVFLVVQNHMESNS